MNKNIFENKFTQILKSISAAPSPAVGPDPTKEAVDLITSNMGSINHELVYEFIKITRLEYQSDLENLTEIKERLTLLRSQIKNLNISGFLVPHSDEFQGEYMPLCSQRLRWITGFSGSAGLSIIFNNKASIFIDGRYTLQAKEEVDENCFEILHSTHNPLEAWISNNLSLGEKLGFDPKHCSYRLWSRINKACLSSGGELIPLEYNPIDMIWKKQPPPPLTPTIPHPIVFSGESHSSKINRIALKLLSEKIDVLVINSPDSIAWLLNIRGSDVPNTPLSLSFAILYSNGKVDWFINKNKLDPKINKHLGKHTRIRDINEFESILLEFTKKRILVSSTATVMWIINTLKKANAEIIFGEDPCQLQKSCKNNTELEGMRSAHLRDGAALCKFLSWLKTSSKLEQIDEISAQEKINKIRSQNKWFRSLSFDTISGFGANGAIIHYRVSAKTNKQFKAGSLYLVDSGGQYLDGTTDVTRTVSIGLPDEEMKDRFTRVLRGHIELSSAIFPLGTTGSQLDILARKPLWEVGLDFDHGTGHGVGSFLGVHEGPQSISSRGSNTKLLPGMVLSNEPGYYKTNEFGIRIENLVEVIEIETPKSGERKLLGFRPLTLVPIDKALINKSLLSKDDVDWLNSYHALVLKQISPLVDKITEEWLIKQTAPIQ